MRYLLILIALAGTGWADTLCWGPAYPSGSPPIGGFWMDCYNEKKEYVPPTVLHLPDATIISDVSPDGVKMRFGDLRDLISTAEGVLPCLSTASDMNVITKEKYFETLAKDAKCRELRERVEKAEEEAKRLRSDLRAATQELMSIAHEEPHDVEIYDEDGKKYIIRWDNGDESVGIRAGWVSEDLDEVFDTKKRLRGAVDWALGERDFFPSRPEGKGAYWWRIELRERAGAK